MISVSQIQSAIGSLKAENRFLKRLVEKQKQHKQRLPEYEYEGKGWERPVCPAPELDAVLADSEQEAEELMAWFRL